MSALPIVAVASNPHYQRLGGEAAIAQLVDAFYDAMDRRDDARAIRAMHATDLSHTKAVLRLYVICDRALLGAYAGDRPRVAATTVPRAAREIRGVKSADGRAGRLGWAMGLAAVAVALAGLLVFGIPALTSLPWGERIAWLVPGHDPETPVARATSDSAEPRERTRAGGPGPRSPSPTAGAADGRRPAAPRLADLLSDPSLGSDDHAAFASLYALWGREYRKTSTGLG